MAWLLCVWEWGRALLWYMKVFEIVTLTLPVYIFGQPYVLGHSIDVRGYFN